MRRWSERAAPASGVAAWPARWSIQPERMLVRCDEVGGQGVATALHDVDALADLAPVAGEAAEGLGHVGEEGDGAGAGGFAGLRP